MAFDAFLEPFAGNFAASTSKLAQYGLDKAKSVV
jgi:hypothetical protein